MWRKQNEAKPASGAPEPKENSTPKPSVVETPVPSSSATAAAPVTPVPAPVAFVPAPPIVKPAVYSSAAPSSSASVIGAGLKIRGEISGASDLYLDGDTQGKIQMTGARVTVGPNGKVQADIDAREIFVEGSLQGNLKATETVHLGPASKVQGSVLAPRIGIEDGARLRGKVEMVRANDMKTSPKPQSTPEKTKSASESAAAEPSTVPAVAQAVSSANS